MASQKKNAKNRMLNKFIKVFIMAFVVLMIVVGIGTGIYILVGKMDDGGPKSGIVDSKNPDDTYDPDDPNQKKITSFAIFGVDQDGYRTDVVMLLFFNRETKNIDIVSVPRDTKVVIPDDMYAEISETRNVNQEVKINAIPAYVDSSPTSRNEASVKVIEANFGIDVDYYMNLDLDAFIKIVDLIGPIEVNVPIDMKYNDPTQDLYIDLDAGLQPIDGAKAEELIRFRKGYADGDLGRIKMQHEFMLAFVKELLTLENKVNMINTATTVLMYLETDFTEAVDYMSYIDDLAVDNIKLHTLEGDTVNEDQSYFIFDEETTDALFDTIINGVDETVTGGVVEPVVEPDLDVKTLSISVQNGTNISGLASKTKVMLQEKGYQVTESKDYEAKPVTTTRLLVPNQKVGQELAAFFNDSQIEVDADLVDQDIQIIIVLGESEGE